MVVFKKYISGIALIASSFFLAQVGSATKQYPQMYENQTTSISKVETTEKPILSAKELVDINLNGMMNDPVLRNANWGFALYDPKVNKMICSHNADAALVPASTTKLLTTETALNLLGPDFRWVTQLEYSGEIDEKGTLNGNLYIVGSGDPILGTGKAGSSKYGDIVNLYIDAIKEKGIQKIAGDLIIQNALFKENKDMNLPENIVWMDFNNYYLPVGSTKEINPRNERLISKANNPFKKTKSFFYISPYAKKTVYADEYEGINYTTKLPDPPFYLANSLKSNLSKRGISITGAVVPKTADIVPEARKFITAYKSPKLSEIVTDTNKRSDNANAEALLRMLGFQKNGDQTIESGRSAVIEHLATTGFDLNGLSYFDGSGLSRNNKVSPISHVKYLTSLMKKNYYKDFYNSLPIAGQDGTLKNMFLGNGYGLVRAKTGTLNGVKTLAGYLTTKTGKTLVFSILINNYRGSVSQVKQKIEQILEPVYDL